MRHIALLITFLCASLLMAQSGPAQGSITGGHLVSTTDFAPNTPSKSVRLKLFNKIKGPQEKAEFNPKELDNFVRDAAFTFDKATGRDSIILFQNYEGIEETNSIPPDPYLAVGPNHIMELVNTSFRITDKEGNVMATIGADSWYSASGTNYDPFDPKVIYDNFANRWVMVWLHQNDATQEGYYLVSVSDDDDPNGDWYNFVFSSNKHGNTPSGTWGDYQGVGFDQRALYITSNNFSFSGSFQGAKIRIIPKSELYKNDGSAVTYNDFYNINDFGVRPIRAKTETDDYYFVRTYQSGHSTLILYTLSDPLTNPTLSKQFIPVNFYGSPNNPNQLGGNELEGGSAQLRNEPVLVDGKLHLTHVARNGAYSAVRYLCLDAENGFSTVKDFTMGEEGYYYFYSALAVNELGDAVITYSRSADDEYVGAYYTVIRADSDEPLGSFTIREGKANYLKDFGGGRNRWGDYMGAYVDPVDGKNVWLYTEYTRSQNTWANRVAAVRTVPFANATINVATEEINFGDVEVGSTSDNHTINIINHGETALVVSSVTTENGDIAFAENISFPVTLNAYDKLELTYQFKPSEEAEITDEIKIASNDANTPEKVIPVTANGYAIGSPSTGIMYAVNSVNNGLYKVDILNLESEEIGISNHEKDLFSLTYDKNHKELVALYYNEDEDLSEIYRINALGAQSYVGYQFLEHINAMTADTNGVIYAVTEDQKLYTLDLDTQSPSLIGDLSVGFSSMAYNETDHMLYANIHEDSTDVSKIFTINPSNAEVTELGSSGLEDHFRSLVFDGEGNLYGNTSEGFNRTYVYSVDQASGTATQIGRLSDIRAGSGFVFVPGPAVGIEVEDDVVPTAYALEQNYPNPFNPSTTIKFTLPETAKVKLEIFNALGEKVATLVNKELSTGAYSFKWNTADNNVASGVYVYRLSADGGSVKFNDTKKMILVK